MARRRQGQRLKEIEMAVKSTKPYHGVPRDSVGNFLGNQIVYFSWDHHLLFAASFQLVVPQGMTVRQLIEGPLSALLAPDPDAASIDWTRAGWLKSGRPWVPDLDRSLVENGVAHKELLRLQTPGLNALGPRG
jgi:phenol hydroxylase P4 protein